MNKAIKKYTHTKKAKRTIGKKNSVALKRYYENGNHPWNYGLSAETDDRVKKYGKNVSKSKAGKSHIELFGEKNAKKWKKKQSKSMKMLYKSGVMTSAFKGREPWNKGLTKFTDERLKKLGEHNRKLLTGKGLTNATLKKMFKAAHVKPNKFEQKCMQFLNAKYPGRFTYCGNGFKIMNGKCPDAIDKSRNIVVLFNGVYWHLDKQGMTRTERNKRKREKLESAHYLKMGYKVLFIWEDEIDMLIYKLQKKL